MEVKRRELEECKERFDVLGELESKSPHASASWGWVVRRVVKTPNSTRPLPPQILTYQFASFSLFSLVEMLSLGPSSISERWQISHNL